MNLRDHALTYADQGNLIFPLRPNKTPYSDNGMKDGTTDAERIRQWWTEHPDALIGCRIPEELVVLDIDPRHGGDVVWDKMIEAYGAFNIGRLHRSGRNDGGFHAWGKHPGGKLSTKRITEWAVNNDCAHKIITPAGREKWTCGIDILHHGHRYTILPPSPHQETGQPYEWDKQGEPAAFPGWLTAMLEPLEPKPNPTPPTLQRTTLDSDSIADWYTATARWADILTGWHVVGGDGEHDGSKWRHPNATADWSATIKHGCLFVYTDLTEFEQTETDDPAGYTKFKAFAEAHHGGNMSDAARAARVLRDGTTPPRATTRPTAPDDAEEIDEAAVDDTPWPDPVPLQGQRNCPPFPIHVLPDWMSDMARMVAVEMQYPPDLPAQLAITAVSVCISRRVTVQVDGPWVEDTNIYTVTAMPPSAGKSPAFKHMLAPVTDYEVDLIEQSAKAIEDREIERKLIEKDRDEAIRKGEKSQAQNFADELRRVPAVVKPRLVAEDITPEKLAMVMAEQGGRMALMSTEGGLFQIMAGRYADSSNLDVFLQAWSGDTISQDRVGRESLVVRNARLVVGLTVQPLTIQQIGDNGEFRGRGLLSRFMYAIPRSTVGKRDKRRRSTWNNDVADRYNDHLRRLVRQFYGGDCMPQLRLSDEAHAVFVDWQQSHEDRMGYNGDLEHLAEWVSKMHSTVCRLAGIMHIAERGREPSMEISEEIMLRAMVVGDYWEAHAVIAGDLWGADPEVANAVRVLRWADNRRAKLGDQFTLRDVMRSLRKHFPKAEAAIPALQILVESAWVRADTPMADWGRGRGGQSALFTLRPEAISEASACGQVVAHVPEGAPNDPTCGKVVAHVAHVPRDPFQATHSLTPQESTDEVRDMRDMGDNSAPAASSPPASTNPADVPHPDDF